VDDLLSDLNEAQRRAVTHGEGPLLVVAGPGSGKTRVVSRRVAWLLRQGARPREVFAVTFTNRAAAELRGRVERLAPAAGLWVATFHAACARILRENHAAAGLPAHFTIYDEEDRRRLAGRVLRALEIPSGDLRPPAVVRQVSEWKGKGVGPEEAARDAPGPREKVLARAYARYEEALAEDGAVDFDDLLLRAHRMLEGVPAVLDRYRRTLRWVLVDEYQDTNRLQFLLARALASGGSLCATGDPDQSIYAWRGADVRNILDFEEHYPDATVVRLERNYRSSDPVLAAAGRLIAHNAGRIRKDLVGGGVGGPEVRVELFGDSDAEGEAVASAVEECLAAGLAASEVAVFYRVNARSRAVETALFRRAIPYQVLRAVEFFQRAEVKDLLAWLRVLANPRDGEALVRMLQAPRRGAGAGAADRILGEAARRGIPAREALLLGSAEVGVRGRAGAAVDLAAEAVRGLLGGAGPGVGPLLEDVVRRTGYGDWLREHWPEDHEERWDNVRELLSAGARHDERGEGGRGLQGFLEEAALVSDQDRFESGAPRVSLMTLHTSKGLEFPAVFIVGVEDGVLPHARSTVGTWGPDEAGMEEERRLLFVGMTRAKRRLWLSAAYRSSAWSGTFAGGPSPFLREIGTEGVLWNDRVRPSGGEFLRPDDTPIVADARLRRSGGGGWGRRVPSEEGADSPFSFHPDPVAGDDGAKTTRAKVTVGQRVRHSKFGAGRVRSIENHGGTVRATVEFRVGVKTLDLDFARLEPLGEEP